jgi:glyoxylase-like metal-dependent hydrolase (beta-lactamase superfamily II)
MTGLRAAVDRLSAAIERKEPILIYGDYDVDGTMAIIILKTAIELCGGAAEFHVLDTPGHTQGSISLWIPSEGKLVAGDTLFRDSIGRTDLPGGNERQILRSIHDKLLPLPDETVVFPGHGDTTTIGREKQFNYFLRALV